MEGYATNNKIKVIDFFRNNHKNHFTIEDARSKMAEDGADIPSSSFYRIVGNLCKSGVLRRFEAAGVDNFVYQYADFSDTCRLHFHLKCLNCGTLIHLECDKMNELKDHIYTEHGFTIGGKGIIYGLCSNCTGEKK